MHAPRFTRHLATIAAFSAPVAAAAQNASSLSEEARKYVSVSDPVVALTNVTLIDGTGSAPKVRVAASRSRCGPVALGATYSHDPRGITRRTPRSAVPAQ